MNLCGQYLLNFMVPQATWGYVYQTMDILQLSALQQNGRCFAAWVQPAVLSHTHFIGGQSPAIRAMWTAGQAVCWSLESWSYLSIYCTAFFVGKENGFLKDVCLSKAELSGLFNVTSFKSAAIYNFKYFFFIEKTR